MRLVIFVCLMILTLDTSTALAARRPRHMGNNAARAAREAAFLQQFDADGNGQLDPTERAAAQQALANLRAGRGANGAGKIAKGQLGAGGKLSGATEQKLMKRFDKNGDGKLDASELEAAKQALSKLADNK